MDVFLSNVVSPVLALFRDFLLKNAVNTIHVAGNVKALNHISGVLKDKCQTVKNVVEAQERGTSKKCTAEVQGWLERAEGILRSSQEIQVEYEKRSCMLGTCCSLNLCSNHSISTRAIEVHQSVEEALKFIGEVTDLVAEMAPPPVQEMSTAMVSTGGQLEVMQEKALTFIRKGTEGTLGIWGMGGVGKTTLLQHINNSLKTDSFVVIFVVASSGCTEEKLQGLIADNQGIPKAAGNVSQKIFEFLVDKDFVLLLDDLWEPLNLEEVGIPHPLGVHKGHKRKVILTTRSLRVCGNMGSGDNAINVKPLEWDESWALFQKNAGEGLLNSSPLIKELAEKMVRECDGHPLALITVGRAMAQNDTIEVWEDALEKLRTSRMHEIPDISQGGTGSRRSKDPISLLKVSYDYLNTPRLKECFLHCALWPEDHPIERDELIECWMGHGLLWHDDEFNNIGEVYREGKVTIDRLLKACLLENVEGLVSGYSFNFKNSRVKMHDLTRDMALWVARDCGASNKKWQVLTNHGKEAASEEAHKISIMGVFVEWKSNPRIGNWLHLTTLILRRSFFKESDFAAIKYCPLLTYLDVSNSTLESFPTGICRMDKLEYLNVSCTLIDSIPDDVENLSNLKFLILRKTRISSIPYGILTNLKRLLVLDISEIKGWTGQSELIIDRLECRSCPLKALGISVGTSSGLDKLSCLSGVSMTALAIKIMENLSTISLLSDHFLGRPHMHSDLKGLTIHGCGSLEHLVVEARCRMGTERLFLSELIVLKEIIWRGVQPKDVLPKLREVNINGCHALEHASWVLQLPSLEYLNLSSCRMLECIAGEEVPIAFRSIRYIKLVDVPKLRSICKQESAFPSLESLSVEDCPALKKLPFSSDPASCGKLQKITGEQEWWDGLELQDNLKKLLQTRFLAIDVYTKIINLITLPLDAVL